MEIYFWIGDVIFVGMGIIYVIRTTNLNRQFQRHLKENHREHWERIYQHQLLKKALFWPVMRNTPVDFLWKSQENFGDPQITEYRRKIRRGAFRSVVSFIAAFVWFGMVALILSLFFRT